MTTRAQLLAEAKHALECAAKANAKGYLSAAAEWRAQAIELQQLAFNQE